MRASPFSPTWVSVTEVASGNLVTGVVARETNPVIRGWGSLHPQVNSLPVTRFL